MKNSFGKKIVQLMGQSQSPLATYGISLFAPQMFTKALHKYAGEGKADWNNKKTCLNLSFDVDYREDVLALPKLIELLAVYNFKTSFAIVGKWVEEFPDEHKLIVDAGHEIVNHSYSHPNNRQLNPHKFFNKLSIEEQKEEIIKCDEVIKKVLKINPTGFRTPHFGNLHTDSVYGILEKLNYTFSSSITSPKSPTFGVPFEERSGLWEIPVSTCPMHPTSTLDTWHALRKPGAFLKHGAWHKKEGELFRMFKNLIQVSIKYGSYINLYFDPQDVVHKGDSWKMLDYLSMLSEQIWIVNYMELLDYLKKTKVI